MEKKKVVLVIRDGYGRRDVKQDNAVLLGKTPFSNELMKNHPINLLKTCGNSVGLPKGYMGGSEVGHLTIGSGRIVWQSLELINRTIKDGSFFEKPAFLSAIEYAKKEGKAIHLMGLLQDKGVHAHQEHLFAILKLLKDKGIDKDKVIIHIFGDGRDSPPASLKDYVNLLLKKMDYLDIGVIGSVIGRYYSMDRDTRWDRTQKAYDLLAKGIGSKHDDVMSAIDAAYDDGETDEFINPRVVGDFTGIFGGDVVMCYNYRTDRVRQLCRALLEDDFSEFERSPLGVRMVVFTNYYKDVPASIVFDDVKVDNLLGEVVSKAKLKQLRISETEKYPHVTFFFNGQIEEPYEGEERVLIPSPRDVPTYDKKPQMSVFEIKSALIEEMDKDYSLIVVNFVNGDMVGHTGDVDAAIKAVESVDLALKDVVKAGLEKGYDFLVFADHGNCEEMSGDHQTSHTLNDVDLILVSKKKELQKKMVKLSYGGLSDVAPTCLELLGLNKPEGMTGKSLIKKKSFLRRLFGF